MTDPLDLIAGMLSARVGLRLDPAIRGRLVRAVRDEAVRFGEDEATYAAQLESDSGRMQDLLNRVTVQETSFFRDPGQFTALAELVLPGFREVGGPVLVWSAGCANGQEPYSLAMTLEESGIADWHIIATDVSTEALARTRAARYQDRELRGLSPARRARHLVPAGERSWEIAPALRDRVDTVRHNLAVDPPPFKAGTCQIVFCRNVLIYFGHDDLVAFLDRLAVALTPSDYLFLGYSESLWQISDRFELVRLGDAFAYHPATMRAPQPAPPRPRVQPRSSPPKPVRKAEARVPTGRERTPRPEPAVGPPVTARELRTEGSAALDRGELADAISLFRKASFLDPDDPVAHLDLGLAFEAAGDDVAARRAFAAARAAIDRCDPAQVESALDGYHVDELIRLLEDRAGAT